MMPADLSRGFLVKTMGTDKPLKLLRGNLALCRRARRACDFLSSGFTPLVVLTHSFQLYLM